MLHIFLLFIVIWSTDTCVRREYDEVFLNFDWTITDEDKADFEDLRDAAFLIIDIQKDFTFGSFGEPCFNTTPSLRSLPQNIGEIAKRFANRGAFVIASKDFHPDNHCSFSTTPQQCLNNNTKYPDFQVYQNSFPQHCMFNSTTAEVMKSTSGDFIGAALHEDLEPHMQDLVNDGHGAIVFKAFHSDWESFSAFEFIDRYNTQWNFTGGWAIPNSMMNNSNGVEIDSVYPSKIEHESYPEGWTSLGALLKQKNIKRIFVGGLVFDYCVKDTSIYSFENIGGENPWESPEGAYKYEDIQTFVITDLSRPSADGGQNLGIPSDDFILGTSEKTISAAGDMLRAGVRFVSSGDIFCNEIPDCAVCEDNLINENITTCISCRDGLSLLANGSCSSTILVDDNCKKHWVNSLGVAIGVSLLAAILSSCFTCYIIGHRNKLPSYSISPASPVSSTVPLLAGQSKGV